MALISMAVYATEENNKTEITERTIEALFRTVDFTKHRIVVVNNASCQTAEKMLDTWESGANAGLWSGSVGKFKVIHNEINLGTAGAVNLAWKLREPGECVVKMDDDCLIHNDGWADRMEEAIRRDPEIGIIGLKRIDLAQNPHFPDPNNPDRLWAERYRSSLRMLPPYFGEPWMVVEDAEDIMGTCHMLNPALLDKIGFLFQPRLYGFDDSLVCIRSRIAGFKNCFLPEVRISHIDPGGGIYQEWKRVESGKDMTEYNKYKNGYMDGTIPIYYNPYQ